MAITITIGDGTDTVTLTATDAVLLSYVQESPAADALSVIETLEVEFIGGNAAVDASIKKLQLLFEEARNRAGGNVATPKVWMTVTIDSDVWRSPVYDGRVVSPNESWLKYERALGSRAATVLVNRAAWWEDNTERQISLTNGNGTDNTAGLNVYLNNTGTGSSPNKQHNYVEITAAKVAGDLPAPIKIYMSHSNLGMNRILIGSNVFSDPANLVHFFDHSSGPADATCAGGAYDDKSCTYPGTNVLVATAGSQVAMLKGAFFRVLGRVASTGTWSFRPVCSDGGSNKSYGARITRTLSGATAFSVIDFGAIPLPPNFVPGIDSADISIGIEASPDSGTRTLNIDYIMIVPLECWKDVTFELSNSAGAIWLDDMEELSYSTYQAAIMSYATPLGGLLKVWPNKLQRFIFQMPNAPNVVTNYTTVKMWYRPRRRML